MRSTRTMAVMMAALMLAATAGPALAVDAPKWVAAVYMAPQSAVGLRWNPVPGATGYKVLRSQAKGKDYAEIYSGAQPQYFDKSVEPAETYYYVLQAVDAAGPSANSDEKSVLIPGEKKRALNPPEWDQFGLTETTEFGKTSFKIGLSWKKSENPDVVAYNLLRSTAKGKDYQQIWSGTETKYVDSAGIEEGKTYYYVLTVLDNAFQESKQSPEKEQLVKKAEKKAVAKASEKKECIPQPTRIAVRFPAADEPQFEQPMDMVIDREGREAYISDQGAAKIFVYDMDGKRVREFGERGLGEGTFQLVSGVALDRDGNVYVSDIGRRKIIKFDSKGIYKKEVSVDKKCYPEDLKTPMPVAVAVNSKGDILVADNTNSRVMVFGDDGKMRGCYGAPADAKNKGPGYFAGMGLMMTDAQDRLIIQDYGVSRSQVLDKEGKALFTIGENVKGLVGAFVKVGKTAPDDKNKLLYACDGAMGNIQAFDYDTGEYKFTLTNEKKALKFNERADWDLTGTRVIDLDHLGRIWVLQGLERIITVLELIK